MRNLQKITVTETKNKAIPSQYAINELVIAMGSFVWKESSSNKLSPYVLLINDNVIIHACETYIRPIDLFSCKYLQILVANQLFETITKRYDII